MAGTKRRRLLWKELFLVALMVAAVAAFGVFFALETQGNFFGQPSYAGLSFGTNGSFGLGNYYEPVNQTVQFVAVNFTHVRGSEYSLSATVENLGNVTLYLQTVCGSALYSHMVVYSNRALYIAVVPSADCTSSTEKINSSQKLTFVWSADFGLPELFSFTNKSATLTLRAFYATKENGNFGIYGNFTYVRLILVNRTK